MKKLVIMLLSVILMVTSITIVSAADYSFLDEMTLSELLDLQTAVESKISAVRTSSHDDSYTGMWMIKYYVDKFNMPTSDGYITNNASDLEGTFCNSAVTNKKLNVRWIIDDDDVAIALFEYGNSRVKNSRSKPIYYDVTMRVANGNRISLDATLYSSDDRLYFDSTSSAKIKAAFKQNGPVSFYFKRSDRSVETYVFTIDDTSGFANAWKQLVGSEL